MPKRATNDVRRVRVSRFLFVDFNLSNQQEEFMIDVNELRKGVTFEYDNSLYRVLDYHHHKPGRGNATIRVKAVNLRSGTNLDMTFQSGDRVQDVRLDYHNVQYLYNDGQLYYFMDLDTYEQSALSKALLGEMADYLKENLEVKLTFYEGEPIDIELPLTIDMEVVEAEPSVRGDTATGVTKRVVTETGLQVQVPGFVETGDKIRVNTSTGSYVTRV
jgi:elongation factor P